MYDVLIPCVMACVIIMGTVTWVGNYGKIGPSKSMHKVDPVLSIKLCIDSLLFEL